MCPFALDDSCATRIHPAIKKGHNFNQNCLESMPNCKIWDGHFVCTNINFLESIVFTIEKGAIPDNISKSAKKTSAGLYNDT